jgi:tRNA-uridine 2-sulfurtransferase
MPKKRIVRALSLMSGGLDSLLAVRLLQEQGVEVTALTFVSPFFGSQNAERAVAQLGCPLRIEDITEASIQLVKNPPHGHGKCLNPCIDCHALMVRKAGEILRAEGYDFIATGEVLGERPMSQNRQSLDTVARESGVCDLLLRPLSARLLPPTAPELSGLVDREKLLAIEGRSRKPQMALAERMGFRQYVQPAGGCLLTDPAFCERLAELLRAEPDASAREMQLLKLGRHFRFPSGAKAIVGRDEKDNDRIEAAAMEGETLIASDITPGPTALLVGGKGEDDVALAAQICASYSDHGGKPVELAIRKGSDVRRMAASPLPREAFAEMKV